MDKIDNAMISGTTKDGFDFAISEQILDDYELMEYLGKAEDNPLAITNVVDKLLGMEQKKRLFKHIKSKCGYVSATEITDKIFEIFDAVNLKNS